MILVFSGIICYEGIFILVYFVLVLCNVYGMLKLILVLVIFKYILIKCMFIFINFCIIRDVCLLFFGKD